MKQRKNRPGRLFSIEEHRAFFPARFLVSGKQPTLHTEITGESDILCLADYGRVSKKLEGFCQRKSASSYPVAELSRLEHSLPCSECHEQLGVTVDDVICAMNVTA
jgi:predicted HD phosphohydrolase